MGGIFKVTSLNRMLEVYIHMWLTKKCKASPQKLHKSASIHPEGEEMFSVALPPS